MLEQIAGDLAGLVRLALGALACYRLAELVALDDGPFHWFARLRGWSRQAANGRALHGWRDSLAELLGCPYCLGVWFAALGGALVIWPSWAGDVILIALGLAGAQAYLEGRNHADSS